MAAFVIKSDDAKNLKLLTNLAEQLGISVYKLSATESYDLHLGLFMKKERTNKKVRRKAIFKHF
jgi:hypothetical protein